MSRGGNREWGYASYDEDDDSLTYTSYERSGSVNRYRDNGDGGHGHEHWRSSSDYNNGKSSDYSRSDSNGSSNPSTGEVQSNGGCYLTTACMIHMKDHFDDNCEELTTLRWFRDNFVSIEDINNYYRKAPIIVGKIDSITNNQAIYEYIYDNIVLVCVKAIKNGDYRFAYDRYKNSLISLEEQFLSEKKNYVLVKRFDY